MLNSENKDEAGCAHFDKEMSIPDRGEGNVREVLGPDAWTVELDSKFIC